MRVVVVLFVITCAMAVTHAQTNDLMRLMLMRNMFSESPSGGGSSGSATGQGVGSSAPGGSVIDPRFGGLGQIAGTSRGGSNPWLQMSAMTGNLGDSMYDMTMCQMMFPPSMQQFCLMQAFMV